MESALKTHGPKSMVFVSIPDYIYANTSDDTFHSIQISFGSFFWSAEPDKIWTFLDVLVEKKIPFVRAQVIRMKTADTDTDPAQILSHGSPFADVPDEVQAKVKSAGPGLLTRWAPQQAVLAHAVSILVVE